MWSRVSNTGTSGLSESVKPTFLGSEVCNELYYWATRSRKTCLKRISNSHCKSRGLNVLLGRMVTPIIAIVLAKQDESNPPSVIAPALSGALYRPTKQFYTGLLHKHNPSGPEILASPTCADCKQYPAAELLLSITLVHEQWAN